MAVADIMAAPARIYRAAVGAAIPSVLTVGFGGDWGASWTDLGETLTPITLMRDAEYLDIEIEQSSVAVGRRSTKEKVVIETTLAESLAINLGMAFAGTPTETAAGAGQAALTEIDTGGSTGVQEWQFGIEGLIVDRYGESTPFRVFLPKATVVLGGALEFSKKTATGVSLRIESVDDQSKAAGSKLIRIQRVNDFDWAGGVWALDADGYAYNTSASESDLFAKFATITGSASNLAVAASIDALTPGSQAGVVVGLDSAIDPQNFVIAYRDSTNIYLEKCVAGVTTVLINTASTFVAGAKIEIRRAAGNSFRLWYSGVQVGTNQTVLNAVFFTNKRYGLFSTSSANKFSNLTIGGVNIPLTGLA